ncbi:MAG: MBL fold metallo-hydrolase [Dehalococcoidia bacterium]
MKLTVLVDNNTLIDRYYIAEPGLSFYIEDGDRKILFDAGYSNAFIANATRMQIDLLDLDFVVLSHGHLDHTWGLTSFIRLYNESLLQKRQYKRPTLVAHPQAIESGSYEREVTIGPILSQEALNAFFDIRLSKEPVQLTERLFFLGEIARENNFEAGVPVGNRIEGGCEVEDFIIDDSALAYRSSDGLVIITGCSHAGICNIIEQAKRVCRTDRVADIIGGFHLLNPSDVQLAGTLRYLKDLSPDVVHACHCTDLESKIAISHNVNIAEVGVGLTLEYQGASDQPPLDPPIMGGS